jgi:hypothetical protein
MTKRPFTILAMLVAANLTSLATIGWGGQKMLAAPPFTPPPDAFQVKYASNLSIGDSVINLSNGGTQGGTHPAGNICANVYVFTPDEKMAACCSCLVTPDALNSLSAEKDLISNTLTGDMPPSILIKLLASKPTHDGNSCTNSASTASASNLVSGLLAWGTSLHALPTTPVTYGVTEEEFSAPQLSASELSTLTSSCQSIVSTGSGAGICASCRLGGL